MRAKEACDLLNISITTLKRWVQQGKLRASLDERGRLVYWEDDVYKMIGRKVLRSNWSVLYVRVPSRSAEHRRQMKEQIEILTEHALKRGHAVDKIYEDYCPATEWSYAERPGIWNLMKDVLDKKILTVFVESRDRIATLGWEMLPFIFKHYSVETIVMNKGLPRKIHAEELSNDIAHLIQESAAIIKGDKITVSDKVKIPSNKRLRTEPKLDPRTWKDKVDLDKMDTKHQVRNDLSDLL